MSSTASKRQVPFIAGNPVGGRDAFVGRVDILEEVQETLCRPGANAVLLHGQRRIGKTSILKQLEVELGNFEKFTPVYFDLQDRSSQSLETVLVDFAAELARAVNTEMPQASGEIREWFKRVCLKAVMEALEPGSPLVVLFDEFDVLDPGSNIKVNPPRKSGAGESLFPFLRELLALDLERLKFVFVIGRDINDLPGCRALFKGVNTIHVSLLTRADLDHLLELSSGEGGLFWDPEAVARVWEETSGHPYLTQQLGIALWSLKSGSEERKVSECDVGAVLDKVLDSSRNALIWIWKGLPPACRFVASILAAAGPGPIPRQKFEELLTEGGVRAVTLELREAPKLLQDWDLIAVDTVSETFSFRVELLRKWMERDQKPQTVRRELDQIDTRAHHLFEAGKDAYQKGDLDTARTDLENAVRSNPNHTDANYLLVQIALEKNEPQVALDRLDKIADFHPSEARLWQVRALELLLEGKRSEDERRSVLERIQAIDPDNRVFKREWERLWVSRGERALAGKAFVRAIRAFQKVGRADLIAQAKDQLRTAELKKVGEQIAKLCKQYRFADALKLATAQEQKYGPTATEFLNTWSIRAGCDNETLYQQAVNAYKTGQRKYAIENFRQLVGKSGNYRGDAVKLLFEVTTDIDIAALREKENLAKSGYAEALAKLRKANEALSSTEKRCQKLTEQLDSGRSAMTALQESLSASEKRCQSLTKHVDRLQSARQRQQSELQDRFHQVHALEVQTNKLKGERQRADAELSRQQAEIHGLEAQLAMRSASTYALSGRRVWLASLGSFSFVFGLLYFLAWSPVELRFTELPEKIGPAGSVVLSTHAVSRVGLMRRVDATYHSDDTSIVDVDNGSAVAKGTGRTRVTAVFDGLLASQEVLTSVPEKLVVEPSRATLTLGENLELNARIVDGQGQTWKQLSADELRFTSKNHEILGINAGRVFDIKRSGEATLQVAGSDFTTSIQLDIKFPTTLKVEEPTVALQFGATYPLTFLLDSGEGRTVEFHGSATSAAGSILDRVVNESTRFVSPLGPAPTVTTSNEEVVTVDEDLSLVWAGPGTATVTADWRGLTTEIEVNALSELETLKLHCEKTPLDERACERLGFAYASGDSKLGAKKSSTAATKYFGRLCEQRKTQCANASYYAKSSKHFASIGCDNNDLTSCGNLGVYYDRTDNFRLAGKFYRRACSGGAEFFCAHVGNLIRSGDIKAKPGENVKSLRRRGCKAGNKHAC